MNPGKQLPFPIIMTKPPSTHQKKGKHVKGKDVGVRLPAIKATRDSSNSRKGTPIKKSKPATTKNTRHPPINSKVTSSHSLGSYQ